MSEDEEDTVKGLFLITGMGKDPSFAPGNRLLGTRTETTGRGEEQVDLCGVTYARIPLTL